MLKYARGAAACLLLCCTAWGWAAPYLPSSGDEILARLPEGSNGWSAERRRRHAALTANRFDLQQAVSLARHYIERGRALSNPRHYGHAQAVLEPWWALQNPPPEVLLLRANIRQNRHQFDSALRDLQQLLEQRPHYAQAWLTQAVILQVRGEYRQALASCMPLLRLASTLVATACTSSVASLSGRARDSYHLLLQAVRDGVQSEPGERLWALMVLADIAVRLGWHTQAEQHFQEALSINPRDHYLLAAYADLLLHQRRAAEVVTLLDTSDLRAADSLPTALLLRRVLADRQLASEKYRDHAANLQARLESAHRRGDHSHLALEARVALYLLERPAEALDLALRNWRQQREPADARLVLETALLAGQPEKANPVLGWVTSTGLEDVFIETLAKRLRESEG